MRVRLSMAVRDQLISALRWDLLGPRHGINEPIEADPASEYQVGVLEPSGVVRDPILYFGNAELNSPQDLVGEEDEEERELDPISSLSGIDPRALAKTMGITFITTASSISFCATWARYNKTQKDPPIWKRIP